MYYLLKAEDKKFIVVAENVSDACDMLLQERLAHFGSICIILHRDTLKEVVKCFKIGNSVQYWERKLSCFCGIYDRNSGKILALPYYVI